MKSKLTEACSNYRTYIDRILNPVASEFLKKVNNNSINLHEAFGVNLFVAHAVDYIHAIRKADGLNEGRTAFVKEFDQHFGVAGARFRDRKFELIDAINNSLKHVQLDEKRYKSIVDQYGSISFKCLVPEDGRVLCFLEGYRFDYARSILRPAIRALSGWNFDDNSEILDFARGNICIAHDESIPSYYDWEDPIDQMIEYCNPNCDDCEEPEGTCMCATYVFDGKQGSFEPSFDPTFNFDHVMSRISGAYKAGR
ncbi:hypothetical protein KDW67_33755 [Burkholderia cenocepacia]|uniref:hypothetical protein n=1 Tax=Burkholderia cenocepacia TaxID=95486 RepID=UPI00097C1F05|nr:hypothetical protein [Burkholderia cenocepacia]AQQ50713.1 hypothetical protein A8F32_34240 [Burkholderia cenocepacia]MBR8264944.1 hypothetical protein [Burkholderia cenocepacia]ONI95483.1 hypothetical protein A8F33_39250 [Burkholderia cenocepacia]ONJ06236.1 hypothetical protein A8F53_06265 [Burkholderia cenocepacia]ONJ08099.1 hypothetical protein A8F33_16720 [Burkholderia cenocepacia]